MDSIHLAALKSPISDTDNAQFLEALQTGGATHTLTVNGKPAIVTAVYDKDGNVFMLSLDAGFIEGSIPVDDSHAEPVPRSSKFFRSPLLKPAQYEDIVGIAAYKFALTPDVVTNHAERTAQAII